VRSRFSSIAALFFVSGMTGLLYEVAFSKLLGYVFGATAYAVSAVLAAFMAGLAAGAHFGGRRAAKVTRPLAAYGVLEIGVGLVCAVTPITFGLLTNAYVAAARAAPGSLALLTIVRAGLAGLVVFIPTIAMGATLPILSRLIAGAEGGERRLPVLYALNTGGGALGSLAGAYFLLPALGIRGTIFAAALANIVIGAAAIFLGRRDVVTLPAHETASIDPSPHEPTHRARDSSAPPRPRPRPRRPRPPSRAPRIRPSISGRASSSRSRPASSCSPPRSCRRTCSRSSSATAPTRSASCSPSSSCASRSAPRAPRGSRRSTATAPS
jgi:spermidine synthase